MNNPYDLHSWSMQCREERIAEALKQHLEERLRENHKARSERGSVTLALANVLSLVRGA
jgi:hypothetical protein